MLTRILPLLLLCSTAMGQGFLSYQVPDLSGVPNKNPTPCIASFTDPSQISGLALRWVASDLTNNVAVSNWVDRVQSNHLVQATGANQPTNSSDGVRFDDTKFLTATNWTITQGKDSLFIVIKWDTDAGHDYWVFTNTGNNNRLDVAGGGANTVNWTSGSSLASWVLSNFGRMDAAYFMGTGGNTNGWYTNGVFVSGNTGAGFTTSPITAVGGTGSATTGIHGSIMEIDFYTNITFTADQVCSLHYYATNQYQFSP